MSEWQEGKVRVNEMNLHYTRTGGDASPMILVHGITDNRLCWSRVARELNEYHDVIMVDMRGHGESTKPESGYGPAEMATDVAGLIDSLGVERPVVMGHSMGGTVASNLAANYPDLISGAVLEDPAWFWPTAHNTTQEGRQASVDRWSTAIERYQSATEEELFRMARSEHPYWDAEDIERWVAAKQQVSPAVVEYVMKNEAVWPQEVEKYAVPVFLIYGEADLGGIVSPEMAAEAARINRLVTPHQVIGAGHSIHREAFEEFLAEVKEFLAFNRRERRRMLRQAA